MIIIALTMEEVQNRNDRIEELLADIADGDGSAMGLLYDLIKTDVFAYALSKTGNRSEADDITQDTFVRVYKYAKQYSPQGKPMAWIIRIELNIIRRQFQLKSRSVGLGDGFENVPSEEDLEESVINNAFLKQLLKTLNEEERQVVTLHIVSGMKHREIAKLLNKPLSTVLSKYNRAVKKLQLVVKTCSGF